MRRFIFCESEYFDFLTSSEVKPLNSVLSAYMYSQTSIGGHPL